MSGNNQTGRTLYIRSIRANFRYWHKQIQDATHEQLRKMRSDFPLICRAVRQGANHHETHEQTIDFALSAFHFAELSGEWSEWGLVLEQINSTITLKNPPEQCRLLLHLSQFFRLDHQLEKSFPANLQLIRLCKLHSFNEQKVQAFVQLANCYLEIQDYQNAQKYLNKVLSEVDNFPSHKRWKAEMHNALGRVSFELNGDLPTAKKQFEQALAQFDYFGDRLNYARISHNLGEVHMKIGELANTGKYLTLSETTLMQIGGLKDISAVQISLSVFYFIQGKWEDCEAKCRQVNFEQLEAYGYYSHLAIALNNLGNALSKQQKWGEAESYLKQSIKLWELQDNKLELSNTLGSLSEVYLGQNQLQLAELYVHKAIESINGMKPTLKARNWLEELNKLRDRIQIDKEQQQALLSPLLS